jgi:hypothetical protein
VGDRVYVRERETEREGKEKEREREREREREGKEEESEREREWKEKEKERNISFVSSLGKKHLLQQTGLFRPLETKAETQFHIFEEYTRNM